MRRRKDVRSINKKVKTALNNKKYIYIYIYIYIRYKNDEEISSLHEAGIELKYMHIRSFKKYHGIETITENRKS